MRFLAAILILLCGPALADGPTPGAGVQVNSKFGTRFTLAPIASSGVRTPDWLHALEAIQPGATQDLQTGISDGPTGPISRAFRNPFTEPGNALVVFVQARYSLTDNQIASIFTAAGAIVSMNGQSVQVVIPTAAQIGAVGKAANGGDFANPAAVPANIGAALSSFAQPYSAAVARDTLTKLAETISVTDYCTPSQLATDATSCVQNAFTNSICGGTSGNSAGGTLLVPLGVFPSISAATGITVPCAGAYLQGAGWGDPGQSSHGSMIKVIGSGSAPIFKFSGTPDTTRRYAIGGGARDIGFQFQNNQDAPTQFGPAIYFQTCWGCVAQNVYATHPYRLLTNFGGIDNRITQFQVDFLAKGGEAILNTGSDAGCGSGPCQTRNDIFEIDHGMVAVFGDGLAPGLLNGTCMHVSDYAATTHISNVECNQVGVGLKVDCPTSTLAANCPSFIKAWDLEIEANGTEGPKDGTGTAESYAILASDFETLDCVSCYLFGTAGLRNVVKVVTNRFNQAGPVQLDGGRISGARESCIVTDFVDFEMHGGLVYGCNQAGYTSTDERSFGIDLQNNLVDAAHGGSAKINDVTFCGYMGNYFGTMGPIIVGTQIDYSMIADNVFRGCNQGVLNNSGLTHNVIQNNTAN